MRLNPRLCKGPWGPQGLGHSVQGQSQSPPWDSLGLEKDREDVALPGGQGGEDLAGVQVNPGRYKDCPGWQWTVYSTSCRD